MAAPCLLLRADRGAARGGRRHAAVAGRGLLLGVVARAGAGLPRPSADGGAVDPARHALPGERRWACGCSAPLAAALGSVLLARAGERAVPGRAAPGFAAAVLLNATLHARRRRGDHDAGHAAAVLLDPGALGAGAACDGATGAGGCWSGVRAGLALDSKYTAAAARRWHAGLAAWVPAAAARLRRPWPGLGGAAGRAAVRCRCWRGTRRTAGRASPSRAAAPATGTRRRRCATWASCWPARSGWPRRWSFVLFAAGRWRGRAARPARSPAWALLAALACRGCWCSCSMRSATGCRPTGSAVLYPAAAIAAAALAARRWWRPAAALGFALTALVYLQAAAAPFAAAARLDPTLIRLAGWDGLAPRGGRGCARRTARPSRRRGIRRRLAARLVGTRPARGRRRRAALGAVRPAAGGRPGPGLAADQRSGGASRPTRRSGTSVAPVGSLVRGRGGVEAEAFRVYRVGAAGRCAAPPTAAGRGGD